MKEIKKAKFPELLTHHSWHVTTRDILPNQNTVVTDIDSVIRSFNGSDNCIALVELKNGNGTMLPGQRTTYEIIGESLKYVADNNITLSTSVGDQKIKYFHGTIQVNKKGDKYYIDGVPHTKDELAAKLSFEDMCRECYPDRCKDCCPTCPPSEEN